ncbi:MAG: helix-turn-helix domain-containing protein [Planctomycetia bacterium]|nr:helix-turn-helix domain-containing protein [Planctomycetia bacterium]
MPLPDRLRAARERSGLTQAEASVRSGVGESSLSEFEGGKREPSLGQLEALGRAYHRPFAWFLEETPITSEPLVLWRQRPAAGARDVEGRFLELCRTYRRLEILEQEPPAPPLPQAAGRAAEWDYRRAAELAHTVRRTLALGDRPGPVLLRVLEEVWKIKVFHLDFEPEGTAASHVSGDVGAAILLNRRSVRWRRNHDLAHELFHLLTWNVFHGDGAAPAAEAWDGEEKLATAFAAALLMPEEAFRTAVDERTRDGTIGPEALHDVARSFDVSVESAIWRLHYVYGRRVEDGPGTRQLIERAKALTPSLAFRHDSPAPELPARFESLAWHALRGGRLSVGTFARMTNTSRAQALRLLAEDARNGEAIPIPSP